MREADGNKRLRWAFGLALLLHAAALGVAAQLPDAVGSLNGDLDQIRVFGAAAPTFVSRVDLVEWPAEAPPGDAVEFATVDPAPIETGPTVPRIPEPLPTVRPPSRQPDRQPARPAPEPVVRTPKPVRPAPAIVSPAPVAPAPAPADGAGQAGDGVAPGGGGGGGGGSVALGSPSPNGTIPFGGNGGTPAGEVPGNGTGSGPGTGPGSGGGSGGGSGSGRGNGEGPGVGNDSGAGTGGGHGNGGTGAPGSGFTSRVADRREPQVLWKGPLEYPASAARDGREGTVRLRVLVGETGEVLEAKVIGSSGTRSLDRAAVECVRTWRYLPAVQDGKPRQVHTEAKVMFKLT